MIKFKSNIIFVFIDASVFRGYNLDFNHRYFEKLIDLVGLNKIQIISTEITKNETLSNIKEQYSDVYKKWSSVVDYISKNSILSHGKLRIITNYKIDTIEKQLIKGMHGFYKKSKAKVIKYSNMKIDNVFEKYFQQRPPFGAGKKKCEFPDAIILNELDKYRKRYKAELCIVSKDSDMLSASTEYPDIIFVEDLSELLDYFAHEDSIRYSNVMNYINANTEIFQNEITEILSGMDFELEDYEEDLVSVYNIETSINTHRVSDIKNDVADVECDIEVSFSIETEKIDEGKSAYDSEEGKYIFTAMQKKYRNYAIQCVAHLVISINEAGVVKDHEITEVCEDKVILIPQDSYIDRFYK